MNSYKIKWFCLILFAGLIFQGCSEDEDVATTVEELRIDNNDATVDGGGNNNGGNNNGNNNNGPRPNDENVSNLESDLVVEWTDLLLELERYAAGMRPNASARALAYIHLATYETALPGMPNHRSNASRLQGLRISNDNRARNIDWQIALNACYADVLDHFLLNVPTELNSKIETLESEQESNLSANLSDRLVEDSKQWGAYVANQVIRYSQTDDEAEEQITDPQPTSYEPPTGDGFWTYSADPERALFPYWESVRTFVVSPDQTTTVDPLAYSEQPNSPYYSQMMEVYNINNDARDDDGEQLWIAEFWSDDVENIMFSPPARQFSIANQLIDQRDLDLAQTLTLYVKLGFSLNDAAVSTWKYKYDHMVMRPSVYLQDLIDPEFQTNLYRLIYWPNPGFPGYPSGHSCFASAAAGVFIDFFGSQINFTDRSHEGRTEFRGSPRSFSSFEEMAEENAFSRIPLGVHIRMDCTEGLRLGYEISDAINDLDLVRDPS